MAFPDHWRRPLPPAEEAAAAVSPRRRWHSGLEAAGLDPDDFGPWLPWLRPSARTVTEEAPPPASSCRWHPGRSPADPTGPEQLPWLRRRALAPLIEETPPARSARRWQPGYYPADPDGSDRFAWRQAARHPAPEPAGEPTPAKRWRSELSPPAQLPWLRPARLSPEAEADVPPVTRRPVLPDPAPREQLLWRVVRCPAPEPVQAPAPTPRTWRHELFPAPGPFDWLGRKRPAQGLEADTELPIVSAVRRRLMLWPQSTVIAGPFYVVVQQHAAAGAEQGDVHPG